MQWIVVSTVVIKLVLKPSYIYNVLSKNVFSLANMKSTASMFSIGRVGNEISELCRWCVHSSTFRRVFSQQIYNIVLIVKQLNSYIAKDHIFI